MKKDDYKTEFEEQRKEIDLADGEKVLSRVDLHSKNKKVNKRSRFSLINVLLITFTLIPIGIFAFVIINIYMSKDPITPKADDNQIQFETSDKNGNENAVLADKEEQEKQLKEAEEQKEKEELARIEEQKKAEEQRKKEEEQSQAEERKKEEEKQKELARQQAEEQKKKEQAQAEEQKSTVNQGGKTHIVAPGETLYRISVNYYQSGDGVEKIKSANGLSSNSISVGQKLIIP